MPALRTIRKIISDQQYGVFARSASWSPDGNRILIGNNNGEICIQDWKRHENTIHDPIPCIAPSPLVHGDDPEDDNELLVVNYNADGSRIVSGSYNAQLKVWDSSTGERLKTLFCGDEILDAKISDDGNKIVILLDILDEDGGEIIIWNYLQTIPENGDEDDNIFHLFDEVGPEHMYVTCMDLNKNRIITGEIDENDLGYLCCWDLDSIQLLHRISLEHIGNELKDVKFDTNGTKIVTSSQDNKVRIWSTETWACLLTIDLDIGNVFGYPYTFFNVCFSPDGTKIACSTYNNHFIRVFNSDDGNEIIYYRHDRVVHSVKFSPDNERLLFLDDGNVYVWDLFTDIERKRKSQFRMGVVMPLQRDELRQPIDNKVKEALATKDISNEIMEHVSGGKSKNTLKNKQNKRRNTKRNTKRNSKRKSKRKNNKRK